MPRISFALPVFNEQSGIDAFHAGMTEALTARPDLDVEFVYVNDGSLDESLARLIALQRADARIRIVDLSRNFGHQLAITAGIEHCTGDAVVIMDTDLQDPPAVSLESPRWSWLLLLRRGAGLWQSVRRLETCTCAPLCPTLTR